MAVIGKKSWREGDSFAFETEDDWAPSRRHTYTPYLHENGKWRISCKTQDIDSEDDDGYEIDERRHLDPMRSAPKVIECDSKQAAIKTIKDEFWDGYTGSVKASRNEREYESEAMDDIERLMAKD
jgi:hypothetical protein